MDAETFKLNLRTLLQARGMTQSDLATQCGIRHQWVRRACSRGLTRVEDRNREQLQAICKLFEISPVEQLWSNDLHPERSEAAWYGAKVEVILTETQALSDFGKFEPDGESSIADLKRRIDAIYRALKESRERLAQSHETLDRQRASEHPVPPQRTSVDPAQSRKATEYPAKLSQVFRTNSPTNSGWLLHVTRLIDTLFFEKQASRVVTIFRDREQEIYEDWVVFFGDRRLLQNSVAVALATFSEEQVLTWLTRHTPPDDTGTGTHDDLVLIADWIAATKRVSVTQASTSGGNVSGGA